MKKYPEIEVRKSTQHYDWYEVIETCLFYYPVIRIRKGFLTDYASVPQLLWWLIPPHGRAANASIWHDWMYQQPKDHNLSRREVDATWLRLMLEDNVPTLQAYAMYYMVRWFGNGVWKKYRNDLLITQKQKL